MKLVTVLVLFLVIIVSCNKDKFDSKPTLKLKEVKGNYVPKDGDYGTQFVLEYTDAEGDLAGLPVYFEKISSSSPCANSAIEPNMKPDSSYLGFSPDIPPSSNQKGEITISLARAEMNPVACSIFDTLEQATFKFWFKDRAGNVSDTVTAPPISIEKEF